METVFGVVKPGRYAQVGARARTTRHPELAALIRVFKFKLAEPKFQVLGRVGCAL